MQDLEDFSEEQWTVELLRTLEQLSQNMKTVVDQGKDRQVKIQRM